MADFDSSLPVRTQTNGDVVAQLVDGTVLTQKLAIDASGLIGDKIHDGSGTAITSQANVARQALDVISQSAGPVTPGTAANFSDLIGGQYNSTLPTLTSTQQSAVQLDSRGRVLVTSSNFPVLVDTNYGTVGANTIRTASQIGNATGAADFNFGTAGAQTLRAAALIGNATGSADFNYGAIGAQSLRAAAQLGNATGAVDYNFGAVGAQTLRAAAQIGNASGAADFNSGAPTAQTLRVAADIFDATGNPFSLTNPLPVVVTDATPGTPVNDYKRAIAIAAGATDTHDYTVTALKTLYLNQIEATGSGKAKMEVEIETGVATGVFNTRWVQFNSTADTNMSIHIDNPVAVAAGVRVRVVMTNKDLTAQDMYSTISGYELP